MPNDKEITAVQEATIAKREIEKYLEDEFAKFSENTGLLVASVSVRAIETTTLDDEFKRFGAYEVGVNLYIP